MKKNNIHIIIGSVLAVALAAFILFSKFDFSKKYKIADEFKDELNNNITTVLLFVEVKDYETQNLYDISKEICVDYLNDQGANAKNIKAIVLQLYKESAIQDLDSNDIKALKEGYPKLSNRLNDLKVVKNGYVYRAFYDKPDKPSISLMASDLYLPKSGIKAKDLFKN